jgi:hypothetical protein
VAFRQSNGAGRARVAKRAQQRWREQLASWRQEAEARCESQIRAVVLDGAVEADDIAQQAAQGCGSFKGGRSRELDAEVRRLAAVLVGHELKVSRRCWRFHRGDGGVGSPCAPAVRWIAHHPATRSSRSFSRWNAPC